MFVHYKDYNYTGGVYYSHTNFGDFFDSNALDEDDRGIEKRVSASLQLIGKVVGHLFKKGLMSIEEINELFPYYNDKIVAINDDFDYKHKGK